MAEVYRPDVLSLCPVPKSELLHSPQWQHGFSKTQPSQRQKATKGSAHGSSMTTLCAYLCFCQTKRWFRRNDGCVGWWSVSLLTRDHPAQTSRHAVPTSSAGVFYVFYNILMEKGWKDAATCSPPFWLNKDWIKTQKHPAARGIFPFWRNTTHAYMRIRLFICNFVRWK